MSGAWGTFFRSLSPLSLQLTTVYLIILGQLGQKKKGRQLLAFYARVNAREAA